MNIQTTARPRNFTSARINSRINSISAALAATQLPAPHTTI